MWPPPRERCCGWRRPTRRRGSGRPTNVVTLWWRPPRRRRLDMVGTARGRVNPVSRDRDHHREHEGRRPFDLLARAAFDLDVTLSDATSRGVFHRERDAEALAALADGTLHEQLRRRSRTRFSEAGSRRFHDLVARGASGRRGPHELERRRMGRLRPRREHDADTAHEGTNPSMSEPHGLRTLGMRWYSEPW